MAGVGPTEAGGAFLSNTLFDLGSGCRRTALAAYRDFVVTNDVYPINDSLDDEVLFEDGTFQKNYVDFVRKIWNRIKRTRYNNSQYVHPNSSINTYSFSL